MTLFGPHVNWGRRSQRPWISQLNQFCDSRSAKYIHLRWHFPVGDGSIPCLLPHIRCYGLWSWALYSSPARWVPWYETFFYIIPGILLSYSAPFILLARPSPGSCAVLRWCCILSYRWHLTLLAPRGFEVVPQSQTYCVAGARREFIPTYHICVLMSQVNMLTKVILSPKEITIPESRFLLLWKEGEIPLALQSG